MSDPIFGKALAGEANNTGFNDFKEMVERTIAYVQQEIPGAGCRTPGGRSLSGKLTFADIADIRHAAGFTLKVVYDLADEELGTFSLSANLDFLRVEEQWLAHVAGERVGEYSIGKEVRGLLRKNLHAQVAGWEPKAGILI